MDSAGLGTCNIRQYNTTKAPKHRRNLRSMFNKWRQNSAAILFCLMAIMLVNDLTAQRIDTIAGTGQANNNGAEGPAETVNIGQTFGVETGPDNALYVCEVENHRVRRIDLTTKQITTVAGNGRQGYAGDGGPAAQAAMNEPYEIRFDARGNLFVVEMQNHIVRRIDAQKKTITTVVGTGHPGFSGDGGQATKAQLSRPHSIALDTAGNLYIADIGNHRIRRVDLESGLISTFAGNGQSELPSDGDHVSNQKPLLGPRALYITPRTLWVALREGHSIWRIDIPQQVIHHVGGTGQKGYSGDGGSPLQATFNGPKGITVDARDRVYVVDTENQAIRRIDTRANEITTVAGNGQRGFSGDGGSATAATMDRPHGICLGSDGKLYIGDTNNHRVRVVHVAKPRP